MPPEKRCRIALLLFAEIILHGLISAASGQTPAEDARAAAADCQALPAAERPFVQYLSLAGQTPESLPAVHASVSYALNAISRTATISRPILVPRTNLLRFSWATYATDLADAKSILAAREALGQGDPYFRITTAVLGADGKPKTTRTFGGWAAPEAQQYLLAATGSYAAICRADYFFAQAIQPPHYYALAGVPDTLGGLWKLLGVDEAAQTRLNAVAGANQVRSGVTFKPRKVARFQGPAGGAWITFDHADSREADKDPIRYPLREVRAPDGTTKTAYRFDASEVRAIKANGFFLDAIFDADGKRADVVPDKIARDTSDPSATDSRLVPMLSCVRCHAEDGVRPFENATAALLRSGTAIYSYDPENVRRATDFYLHPRLQPSVVRDREDHAAAVRAATGLPVPQAVLAFSATFRRYAYDLVSPSQAALELAVPADAIVPMFRLSTDPILRLLATGQPIDRGQWESSYSEAAILAAPFQAITPRKS